MLNFWSRKLKMMCRFRACYSSVQCRGANLSFVAGGACREAPKVHRAIRDAKDNGFSLVEATVALVILALFGSSVLVVINRCTASAADSIQRMRALEVVRENMEALLASASVEESTEFGESEKYPEIKWETVVETFYEPITSRMWVRGVCTAEYKSSVDEVQTIELVHWLTNISKEQLLEMMERDEKEKQLLAGQVIETIEEAAAYAGVDVETIEQWIDDGMLTMENDSFAKQNLDLYKSSDGKPTPEQEQSQVQTKDELVQEPMEDVPDEQETIVDVEAWLDEIDPFTGLTNREIEEMSVQELFDLLMKRLK